MTLHLGVQFMTHFLHGQGPGIAHVKDHIYTLSIKGHVFCLFSNLLFLSLAACVFQYQGLYKSN